MSQKWFLIPFKINLLKKKIKEPKAGKIKDLLTYSLFLGGFIGWLFKTTNKWSSKGFKIGQMTSNISKSTIVL